MSFASLPFVGLVAAGVILYYLVPKKLQWVVLLLASMVFYLAGGVKSAVWLVPGRTPAPRPTSRRRPACGASKNASAPCAPFYASGFCI